MATKYLVWKDPACQGKNIEWVELTGKEFYQLTAQPENKGRRFSCGFAQRGFASPPLVPPFDSP